MSFSITFQSLRNSLFLSSIRKLWIDFLILRATSLTTMTPTCLHETSFGASFLPRILSMFESSSKRLKSSESRMKQTQQKKWFEFEMTCLKTYKTSHSNQVSSFHNRKKERSNHSSPEEQSQTRFQKKKESFQWNFLRSVQWHFQRAWLRSIAKRGSQAIQTRQRRVREILGWLIKHWCETSKRSSLNSIQENGRRCQDGLELRREDFRTPNDV